MIKVALTVDIDDLICKAIERVHEPDELSPDYLFDWVKQDIIDSFEMLLEEASQDFEEDGDGEEFEIPVGDHVNVIRGIVEEAV